jgi:hypothetical protein
VEKDYKANEAVYKQGFAVRAQRRAALEAMRKLKPKGT